MGGYEVGDYEFGWLGGWVGLGWIGVGGGLLKMHTQASRGMIS